MKNIHRSQLAWAAFALALAAGTLVAQDGDAASRKPLLLAEALKARDEGNLQVAKQKFEAILAIDPKDMGANEGLTSVNAALAEATTSKQSADAKAAAPTDGAPAAPAAVVAPAASGALDEVAIAHQNRFDEVTRAIEAANLAQGQARWGRLRHGRRVIAAAASGQSSQHGQGRNRSGHKTRRLAAQGPDRWSHRKHLGERQSPRGSCAAVTKR